MTQHVPGQNPLVYAGLAAIFVAVVMFMYFYSRRMRSLGNKNQTATQDTPSEIARELRADGTKIDASISPKER